MGAQSSTEFVPPPPPPPPSESNRIPVDEWKKTSKQFIVGHRNMEWTFHRFPASLRELDSRFVEPLVVALGPYHHGEPKLQEMEKLKCAAADRIMEISGRDEIEIYEDVSSAAGTFRRLYLGDKVVGMSADEFATMMLLDACFLLQYIRVMDQAGACDHEADASMQRLFISNRVCIENDIMLLENQIPLSLVDLLNRYCRPPVALDKFISLMGSTFKISGHRQSANPSPDYNHNQPHLLALFRFTKVGYKRTEGVRPSPKMAITASATELAEMAIKITPSQTSDFMDMGIWTGKLKPLGHLYLAPLFLDETRACWLVNMAALEVCTSTATATASNDRNDDILKSKTAVCSYLALLAMLMNRVEDVHEMRTKHLVQAKLTDKEALDFFKSVVKRLDGGRLYSGIMAEIDHYKLKRKKWIKVYSFVQENRKTIIAVLSIIGVLVGIFKTLMSLKTHQ